MKLSIGLLLLFASTLAADVDATAIRYVPDANGDGAGAVVGTDKPLLHTPQAFGADAGAALAAVEEILKQGGADIRDAVRLNVVATTQAAADTARETIHKRFPQGQRPPVSYVVGALPFADAQVAIDVVAFAGSRVAAARPTPGVLLPGPRVYISGQAEKGGSPAEAAAKTIASLKKTLEFIGATGDDVVQAKCFLTPMSAAADVGKEFDKAFGEGVPLVFVEWKSDLPIEIELIAAAPPATPDAPAVEYLTPPGVKASPLFARVVRINRGDVIYTAGLYAEKSGTGEQQVRSIFDQLQRVLKQTGGNLRHLAKATYYVSDDDASRQLNALRPKFYDPQRPPAASKAMVPGVGMKDRSIAIDMIGVGAPSAP